MLIELIVAVALAFLCLLLHVVGILLMSEWVLNRRDRLEETRGSIGFGVILLVLFSLIMVLHLTEASLWAAFYYKRGLFVDWRLRSIFRWAATRPLVLETYCCLSDGDSWPGLKLSRESYCVGFLPPSFSRL